MVKNCRVCGSEFEPFNSLAVVCSVACSINYAATSRAATEAKKARRRERAARRRDLETVPELTKKAQRAFNRFIRARDRGKPCISCGREYDYRPNQWDAGHFISVGSDPSRRFDPRNCHGQCKKCNRFKSGNAVGYERGLVERFDQGIVDYLKGPSPIQNYRHDELRQIAKEYNFKARELEKRFLM